MPDGRGTVLAPLSRSRQALARRKLKSWSAIWGVSALDDTLTVAYNKRLTRSLGRCASRVRTLHLHPFLEHAPAALFSEVLCHEAAHIAAHRLGAVRAHGVEWRELMERAGYAPRVKLFAPRGFPLPQRRQRLQRYEHFCPVCQWSRTARQRMTRWRCADCAAAGLEGRLVIVPAAKAHG